MTETAIVVRRLGTGEVALARQTLRLVAEVFEESSGVLSEAYVSSLLTRTEFWALAALQDGVPIGGLTAHALPLTRIEATELFIYDLAVHPAHQRQGVGRALMEALRAQAAAQGISVAFVPADNEDEHALEFYQALGGAAAPVTIFTFNQDRGERT